MTVTLPAHLREFLSAIGYPFPATDEDWLTELAGLWARLSALVDGHVSKLDRDAAEVWSVNASEFVDAFRTDWADESGPVTRLTGGATGADIVAAGLMVCAGIVLALKISVIVQVVTTVAALAAAVAAAVATGGATAALVLALRESCRRVLDYLTGIAVGRVLTG